MKKEQKIINLVDELCLNRKSTTYEYCYVMAADWEDAENQGNENELDWEQSDVRTQIIVEECES